MTWPWQRTAEVRESSFTDLLVSLAVNRASGTGSPKVTATGALQAAAGLVSRCFAAATVEGPPRFVQALTPACLSMVGRALMRAGETVMVIDVSDDGAVKLRPASHWDVQGGVDPETWRYRCNLPAPSSTVTRMVDAPGVVHVRYETDPAEPWRGIGPIESASLAGRLSAETSAALGDEASGPRGALLPLPVDGADPTVTLLKADIKSLAGQVAMVESVRTMHPGADRNAPAGDWVARRIGADPPAAEVKLHSVASAEVMAACGVPSALFDGEGTAQRESFRRFLHSTLQPLGRIVSGELSAKFDAPITLSFDALFAADLSGRARAFQSLVGGGMDPGKAAGLAGLMESDA